jgi:hypothetical protein
MFFVNGVKFRAVQIAGVDIAPNGDWTKQTARNLLGVVDGSLRESSCLITIDGTAEQRQCGAWRDRTPVASQQTSRLVLPVLPRGCMGRGDGFPNTTPRIPPIGSPRALSSSPRGAHGMLTNQPGATPPKS